MSQYLPWYACLWSWLGDFRLASFWCGHAVAFALEELLGGLELGGDFGLLVGLLFLGVVVGRGLSSGIGYVVVECKPAGP